jgi:hypothetical protein
MKYPDPNRNYREFFENFINSQIAIEEPFAPFVQILDRSFHPAAKNKKKIMSLSYPPIEYFYTSRIA